MALYQQARWEVRKEGGFSEFGQMQIAQRLADSEAQRSRDCLTPKEIIENFSAQELSLLELHLM